MTSRNATAAIIGAGDYIGSAIAKKFAAEGYAVFAGRRSADKLEKLKSEIEAADGACVARGLDARKEEDIIAFLNEADAHAPLEVCIFNPGANVNFPILETTERVFRKVWEMACYGGFLTGREAARHMLKHGKGTILFTGATASCAAARATPLSRPPSSACAPWRRRWRASWGLRISMSPISSSTPVSIPLSSRIASAPAAATRRWPASSQTSSCTRNPSPTPTGICTSRNANAWTFELDVRALQGNLVMPKVEFLFDFGSPNAFLSWRVIPGIEKRTGATFEVTPVLLGGIFKATGNKSPVEAFAGIRNKLAYENLETQRFVKRHGIADFRMNPFFPVNTLQLMRMAVAAQKEGYLPRYMDAIFHHMWIEPKKMDDPEVVRAALAESSLDPALLDRAQAPEVKPRSSPIPRRR